MTRPKPDRRTRRQILADVPEGVVGVCVNKRGRIGTILGGRTTVNWSPRGTTLADAVRAINDAAGNPSGDGVLVISERPLQ